jgi:multiple sugar transport system ATP-binding protein
VASIVIEHLKKLYAGPRGRPIRAVDDLSLKVEKGELLTLVGPSGCGKTTTLRLLSGLEAPSSGTISIDGRLVNGVAPKERDIAMVFQNPALYPHLTALENIEFGLRLRKCPRAELDRRVKETAELLNLTDCLERRPAELSGGQCQRVALGRAIVRRPAVFLFDEPLSNLDPQLRNQLRAEIARLHRRLGCTMIYVTHDQGEASMLGDRIGVMNRGAIQQVATARELYRNPRNVFVAGFIGSPGMNFFTGRLVVEGQSLEFEEHKKTGDDCSFLVKVICPEHCLAALQAYTGQQVVLGIRPEDIHLAAHDQGGSPPHSSTMAVIEFIERIGGVVFLHLRRGEGVLVVQAKASDLVSVGQTIHLEFDLSRVRFFDARGEVIACEH